MKRTLKTILCFALCFLVKESYAQTDWSLFLRSDSLLVNEIHTDKAVMYKLVGHHGPAVENSHAAFRIYYNDSGAIDLYSKSGEQMELAKYKWYPTPGQQDTEGAGIDEYYVGKTVGCGGIALWDGNAEVKLKATKGRTARAGKTETGAYAEIISYGVVCAGEEYDISVRIDVFDDSRAAVVTATELNGREVQFVTGINFHEGEQVRYDRGRIAVWGSHPADVAKNPMPIGAGMTFDRKCFCTPVKTADMVRIVSIPASRTTTRIVTGSSKEKEYGNARRFFAGVRKNQLSQ